MVVITTFVVCLVLAKIASWYWSLKKKEAKVIWWLNSLFIEEKRDDSHGLQHAKDVRGKATELFLLGFLTGDWQWVWLSPHFWYMVRIVALIHDVLDSKYPDKDGSRRKKLTNFLSREFGPVWASQMLLICDNCSWTKEKNMAKELYQLTDEDGPRPLKIQDWRQIFSTETSIKHWSEFLMWVRFLVKEADDIAAVGIDNGKQGYERCILFGKEVCGHTLDEKMLKHVYDVFVTRVNYYPRFMRTRFGKVQVIERLIGMQNAWAEDWKKLSGVQQSELLTTGLDPEAVPIVFHN